MSEEPDYESPEEALQRLRELEDSTSEGDLSPETITISCNVLWSVSTCKLVPYERKDGRIGWVGTGCDRKCKFP